MNEVKVENLLSRVDKNILIRCAEPFIEIGRLEREIDEITDKMKRITDFGELEEQFQRIKDSKERITMYRMEANKKPKRTDCIIRSKIPLRPYQIRVVSYIMKPENDSLLIVHGTGMGKTLSALTASQCYLDENPNNKVVVVSPASLIRNFEKQMKSYGGELDKRYDFYSFDKFSGLNKEGKYNCRNTMLIIDEAHNIKNLGIKRYKAAFSCAKQAHKILLLTATPFVNELHDFVAPIYLMYRDDKILRKRGKKIPRKNAQYDRSLNVIRDMLKGRVTFLNDKKSDDFPRSEIVKVSIPMDEEYYKDYKHALGDGMIFGAEPDKFFHGYRRAVNDVGFGEYFNQKMAKTRQIVEEGKQTLIFTNWLQFGVNVIKSNLDEIGVEYDTVSGSIPSVMRQEIIDKYNAKDYQVLIITRAGGEGLDLKETNNIIILDPVWNPTGLEQIMGRGNRYRSHANMPKSERYVKTWLMVLEKPMDMSGPPSGDELLYGILESKESIKADVEEVLLSISI